MDKDYYKTLGVPRNTSQEKIKKAYRKLAMQFHPDRNQGNEKWANEKFKEINEAYGVLGDPEKRNQYDQFGTVGNVGDIFGSSFTKTTFEDLMKDFGGAGLGYDFLDDIFGESLKGRGFSFKIYGTQGRRSSQSRPGGRINLDELFAQAQRAQRQDVRYQLTINEKQALEGTKKRLTRKGKKLEVRIPPGVRTGSVVKLTNARHITDGQPGDILIQIKVK